MKWMGGVPIIALLAMACSQVEPTPDGRLKEERSLKTPRSLTDNSNQSDANALDKKLLSSPQYALEANPGNWILVSDENGVQTFKQKTQAAGIVSFRGETLIPVSLIKIANILNTDDLRKEWVASFVEAHVVEKISKSERIEYSHSRVPWPFQDRDFVYRANVIIGQDPLEMLITIKSVEDQRAPANKGLVRGEILHSFYRLKEVPGVSATKVVVEIAVDPKGEIPLWLMNLVQKNWPYKTLENLRKISQREDIQISEAVKDFFKNPKNRKTEKKRG